MNTLWIWFVVGLIPYYVNKQQTRNGWVLQVRALFWSLEILLNPCGWHRWTLRVPLIKQLHNAVWAAILHLRRNDPPEE
jgi:hypothetical protein